MALLILLFAIDNQQRARIKKKHVFLFLLLFLNFRP